ncbi:MAG: alpha-amylase family glycosyl hydrolase [Chloroflexi bacterium]|nr:alpha-amylase family glycosyl hydrolase [Chloroflexota bacterium]
MPNPGLEAVIYEVFVRAYGPEGSFAEVEVGLERVQSLGVNTIWLMPIHPTGEVKRKGSLGSPYSIKDYFAIDPALGTPDDFKSLVQAVHRRGMKIIMDAVCNHTSCDSVLLKEYPEYFKRDKKGKFMTVNPEWTDVYDLDYGNPGTREYMSNMLEYWVREFNIDGYRCDVAGLLPIDFWEEAIPRVNKLKMGLLWLAEGDEAFLHPAFHLTYDGVVYKILRDILKGKKNAFALVAEMHDQMNGFPKSSAKMRFIENHDRVRAAALAGDMRTLEKLVAMYTMMRGAVLVYNGQESGLEETPSLFDPVTLEWDKGSSEVEALYRHFLEKRSSPLLMYGESQVLPVDNPNIYGFIRRTEEEWLLVLINFGENPEKVVLALDGTLPEGIELVGEISGRKKTKFPVRGGKIFIEVDTYLIMRGISRMSVGLAPKWLVGPKKS